MKILLLGKNGQVGQALQRTLAPLGELVALDRSQGSDGLCGDLSQPECLAATIRQLRPDVIVNAAAYTAVDKAESEPEQAWRINAHAPEVLAREAEALGAWLVHYSTDYVFNGSGTEPWQETDPTAPLNVYGQSKLEGELRVQAACTQYLIFRTSWVYAAHGSNFAKTMLKLAQERERLTVIDDQWGAPTGAELIASVTAATLQKVTAKEDAKQDANHDANLKEIAGIYHLVAAGETHWHAYASHVISQAKVLRPDMPWAVREIAAVPSSAFVTAAQRPPNSRLNTHKLQAAFGISLPDWQQGVDSLLAEILIEKHT
jgi:dTDP-4-dehydrorhamnose reductase